MNGSIHYIQDVQHSVINTQSEDDRDIVPNSQRVRVAFRGLTDHQSAQFNMLLGVY